MMKKVVKKLITKIKKLSPKKITKNDNPVRWGIIGLGYMAGHLGEAIEANEDGIVVATASRDINKAKTSSSKYNNCKPYGSYEAMISDSKLDVDVIYIATPIKYHFENIALCLQSGKNVLCEKPITFNANELKELQKMAKENGCFLMEAMWMKCLPTFKQAHTWIEEDKIGSIDLIKVDFYKKLITQPSKAIFDSNEGGGVLRDYGVYAMTFPSVFKDGVPDELIGHTRFSSQGIDSDWSIYMCYDKTQVFINISSNFKSTSKAVIIGTKGSIEWESQFNRTSIITLYDEMGKKVEDFDVKYEFDGFEYQVNEVHHCIKEGKLESAIVSIDSSLITLEIIDTLMKKTRRVKG